MSTIDLRKPAHKFDSTKSRMDLIPPLAHIELAKVLTFGANKYGDNNWRNNMQWSRILAALERHLYAIKMGEDVDRETGLLHSAHIMANAAFLTEFYTFNLNGDDRHSDFKTKRLLV